MDKIITPALQTVDPGSQSILPTGRLKIENGSLYQEALVLVHRPTKDRPVGMYHDWIPVAREITDRIRIL